MKKAGWVSMKAIPTDQQVENGHGESQTSLKVGPTTVQNFLEMANGGQHGQNGFDNHAFIVVKWRTHLQIGWIAVFSMKTMIRENDHAIFVALDQGVKGAVMDIGRITIPINHLAEMVEQETQFATHNPTAVGVAFSADLLLRTTLANGMDELNSVTVNDTQEAG